MASAPQERMDPPPRSFAADAHDCIMVPGPIDPTAYKVVARGSRPRQSSPQIVQLEEIRMVLTTKAPYKGGAHRERDGKVRRAHFCQAKRASLTDLLTLTLSS